MRPKIVFSTFALCLSFLLSRAQHIGQAMIGKFKDDSHPLGLKYETYPFFDYHDTTLYVAFRIDSTQVSQNETSLLIEVKKKNAHPEKYEPLHHKVLPLTGGRKLWLDSINISSGLYSGNFLCILSILDSQKHAVESAILPFQVLREDVWKPIPLKEKSPEIETASEIQLDKTFVNKYTREQLITNIEALAPIVKDKGDADFVLNASGIQDLDELKRFFYFFWSGRNSQDPEKAWKEYMEKLMYVARLYGTSNTKGYKTDRGRLYLIYGEPDKVEKILTEKNARPYEIWFYYTSANGRNNVKFLFFQPGVMSNHFILLHSSETDELINPQWMRYLLQEDLTNDKEVRLKHRVFDYFNN